MISLNNRFILEPYTKEGLKAKISGGIAMPGQRDSLKTLKVMVDGFLPNGDKVPAGSTAYIREEVLYSHAWATKVLNFTVPSSVNAYVTEEKKCIIVSLEHIEMFDINKYSDSGFGT